MNNEQEKVSSTDFEDSIKNFRPDPCISPPEPRKKKSGLSPVRIIVLAVCLSVFAYCVVTLAKTSNDNKAAGDLYGDIRNEFADILAPSAIQAGASLPTKSHMLSASASIPGQSSDFNEIDNGQASHKFQQALNKLEKLHTENPDIVGYISVTGTSINYPIVQCGDNDFYLTHSSDKTLSKPGAIFYDYRVNPIPDQNKNLVVYGHNMLNGSMFHNLRELLDNEKLFNESEIIIYSFEGIYTYKIYSAYRTNAFENYLRIHFTYDFEYLDWIRSRVTKSVFKSDVELTDDSRIISLSTCVNRTEGSVDERIAVHGVLVNVER